MRHNSRRTLWHTHNLILAIASCSNSGCCCCCYNSATATASAFNYLKFLHFYCLPASCLLIETICIQNLKMFNNFMQLSSLSLSRQTLNLSIAFTKFCFWFIYAAAVNELIKGNSGRGDTVMKIRIIIINSHTAVAASTFNHFTPHDEFISGHWKCLINIPLMRAEEEAFIWIYDLHSYSENLISGTEC